MMFEKNKKVICQILLLDEDENLLVLKRSNDLEIYPGEYGIAIYGEVQKEETEKMYVSRIVAEWTGMTIHRYEKIKEDIGIGVGIAKRSYICSVSGKKETLQIPFTEIVSYKWLAKREWKDFFESEKVLKNERSSYHDFFYEKGVAPKHYIDASCFLEMTMEEMKQEVKEIRDKRGQDTVCVFAWYDEKIDGVEIYIWDGELQEESFHYIISEDAVWTKDSEAIFERYARDWYIHDCYEKKKAVDCEWVDSSLIYRLYENKYPELYLSYEEDGEPLKLLLTLHYFFQREWKSNLYEKGLGELALFLDETSTELLSDIPLPVLKALNSSKGAELLKHEWQRGALKKFYQKVPEFFDKKLSAARVTELKELLLGEDFGFLWRLVRYWENEDWYNQALCVFNGVREAKYAYQDDCYKVIVIRTVEGYKEKCDEMLVDYCKYMEFIAAGEMCFVYILDRKQNDKTVAAMEMVGNSIIDVYGKCNLQVEEHLQKWVEHYAEVKGLNYRKFENEDDLPLPFD